MASASGVDFDPYSHAWKRDPYLKYRELRDHAPVHHAPASDAWTVSRYDDVQHILSAPEIYSSRMDRQRDAAYGRDASLRKRLRELLRFVAGMRVAPWTLVRARMLIQEDGEVHARMRNLVNRGFTPRGIAAWEKRVRQLAEQGLGRLRRGLAFDVIEELAVPLPVTVIAEMLGVEAGRMRDFKRWSDAMIQAGTGSGMGGFGDGPGFRAMVELRRYLRPIVRARRATPADDLISVLVAAEDERALSDFEIYLFVLLLLIAGNETTTNLLGNAVDALLEHPDQLARVCADPARIPALVEETLRWDSPVQLLTRTANRESELHGVRIPRGAHVVLLLGSANRDERRFPDPDRFDVARDTKGHLAFGFGHHFCLGAALARLESRAALEVLAPELQLLERVRAEREFLDSYVIRGRARLELRPAA